MSIITLSDIEVIRDNREILRNVNLTVERGDFLAITGPNGGGKTTLLRVILKLLPPSAGTVEYFNTAGTPVSRLAIGYLPQKNMIDARFPVSVKEVISSGLLSERNLTAADTAERVEQMLKLVDLESHARSSIGNLSGGQLQRALLGRALISNPEILVLDEPLSYLDKRFEDHIYKILAEVAPHTTIILVSHEMSVISTMSNRHLIVDRTLHECGASHHYYPTECR